MHKDVRQYIREIISLINDDALFHKRDIPGTQDDYEDRVTLDQDPGVSRNDVYSSINDLIHAYDAIGDDYNDPAIVEDVKNIRTLVSKLKNAIR
jgi:hypothetical protein